MYKINIHGCLNLFFKTLKHRAYILPEKCREALKLLFV